MRRTVLAMVVVIAGALPVCAQPSQPTRVGLALVIGNSKYAQAELPSVDIDVKTMSDALKSLNFDVVERYNLKSPREFEEALRSFLKDRNAAPEDILLVYYSGHGVQIEGRAYLVGTGITGSGDMSATLREYSVDVDNIIRIMEQAAPAARVLVVDACRNNLFAATSRKAGSAFQRSIEDTYILFADEPGKTVPARSETTVQSPFTAGLLFAFETSESGIEERFRIAREKTRELNPAQNPQLLKSDISAARNRPFLDHGGRSAPTRSASRLLDEAEEFYRAGSWDAFRDKIGAARILSSEPTLTARLDKEMAFADLVIAALAAEGDPTGAKWADAAATWEKASLLFVSRPWVLEKAALDFLLADRVREAAAGLARLQAYRGNPASERATEMLADLLHLDPSLDAVAKQAVSQSPQPAGPEFEKYVSKP